VYSLGALRRHATFRCVRYDRVRQRVRVHAQVRRFFGLLGLLLSVDLGSWVLPVLQLLLRVLLPLTGGPVYGLVLLGVLGLVGERVPSDALHLG
jgi:hypothetical protein